MFLSEIIPRRVVVGAIGAGAVTGTLLCATAGTAAADPPPRPPNCTAADVAGVAAGVATALSTYLLTHPDVNGRARAQIQNRHLRRPAAPIRFANIEVSAGNLREQMNDADDQRGQCPVGVIENNSDPWEQRCSDQRQKRNGEDKECDRNDDEVCQQRNRCNQVEVPKNQRQ